MFQHPKIVHRFSSQFQNYPKEPSGAQLISSLSNMAKYPAIDV